MLFPPLHRLCTSTVLNNVPYCEHERDICHVCCQTPAQALAPRFFKLPQNGEAEYPAGLAHIPDAHLRELLAKRWLDMQQALFPPQKRFTVRSIKLHSSSEVPKKVQHDRFFSHFLQLHGMAAAQRYFFATQANILLDEYDTFAQAVVLYEKELTDIRECAARMYARDLGAWRSSASIVSTFGYFLGLETQRTFWRVMEMTMEAFLKYLENYDEALDSEVVMEDKAKACLLQCIAHVFWSLQHAQYRLDYLRRQQHVNFQHNCSFPFYPYKVREALEAGLDVHVLVTKLSTAPLYDFPLFLSLFSAFRLASDFPDQMQDVDVEIMAAIDELSTRFRFMEVLILAAAMVATEEEIKVAIATFKFDPEVEEVTSITADLVRLTGNGEPVSFPMQNVSLLQKLLVKAAKTRHKNIASFMCRPLLTLEAEGLTNDMFQAFKDRYSHLYHGTIRPEFRCEECSLLPVHAVQRFQHRKEVTKKKKKQRMPTAQDRRRADISEDRAVPKETPVNPDLFWEVGDGSVEKYVPPPVREKIKTRKQGGGTDSWSSNEGSEVSSPRSTTDQSANADEAIPVYRAVKESDLNTRDILWRKAKGILKWSNLVQFLTRLGCKILNLDGSKKKVVDPLTGRCAVLHRPHPGDDCRPDQRDSYRVHLEDWLHIHYSHVVPAEELATSQSSREAA